MASLAGSARSSEAVASDYRVQVASCLPRIARTFGNEARVSPTPRQAERATAAASLPFELVEVGYRSSARALRCHVLPSSCLCCAQLSPIIAQAQSAEIGEPPELTGKPAPTPSPLSPALRQLAESKAMTAANSEDVSTLPAATRDLTAAIRLEPATQIFSFCEPLSPAAPAQTQRRSSRTSSARCLHLIART